MNSQALEELRQILELVQRANEKITWNPELDAAEARLVVLVQQLEGGS